MRQTFSTGTFSNPQNRFVRCTFDKLSIFRTTNATAKSAFRKKIEKKEIRRASNPWRLVLPPEERRRFSRLRGTVEVVQGAEAGVTSSCCVLSLPRIQPNVPARQTDTVQQSYPFQKAPTLPHIERSAAVVGRSFLRLVSISHFFRNCIQKGRNVSSGCKQNA